MNFYGNAYRMSTKRQPIVICCDRRIRDDKCEELMGELIDSILDDIAADAKIKYGVEITLVHAVADIDVCTSSSPPSSCDSAFSQKCRREDLPSLSEASRYCSSLGEAIVYSYDLIRNRIKEFDNAEIPNYPPMLLILGTRDIPGDDDVLQNDAIECIRKYCDPENESPLSSVVIPAVFAVGRGPFRNLGKYSENYVNAVFPIDKKTIPKFSIEYLLQPTKDAYSLHTLTKGFILERYKDCAGILQERLLNTIVELDILDNKVSNDPDALEAIRRAMDELLASLAEE